MTNWSPEEWKSLTRAQRADYVAELCASVLHGRAVAGYEATWEFPGCIALHSKEIDEICDADGYGCSLAGSPDFANCEADKLIVFELQCHGRTWGLALEPVSWTGNCDADVLRWDAAVLSVMPVLRAAVEYARAGDVAALNNLVQRGVSDEEGKR